MRNIQLTTSPALWCNPKADARAEFVFARFAESRHLPRRLHLHKNTTSWDWWLPPTLVLWALFFVVGMFPGLFFLLIRTQAGVLRHEALVNTPYAVTLLLAGYIGFFVLMRCLDAGISTSGAQSRAIFAGVLAFIAFLDVPWLTFVSGTVYLDGADWLFLGFSMLLKVTAWLYLYAVVLLTYFSGPHMLGKLLPASRQSAQRMEAVPRSEPHASAGEAPVPKNEEESPERTP
jgi:hypothetical protein